MNVRIFFTLLILLLVTGKTFSQRNVVKGTVTDKDGKAVVAAFLSLTKTDSTIISYAITNNDGAYEIRTNHVGEALLHTSHISYIK